MKIWRTMWFCFLIVVAAGCGHAGPRQAMVPLELYSADEATGPDPRCRDYDGRCVLLAEPGLKIDRPRFDVRTGEKPAISIYLSAAQQRRLAHLAEAASHIAVVVGGQVLHVAKLRAPLTGKGLMLSFCNRVNFDRVVQALHPTI